VDEVEFVKTLSLFEKDAFNKIEAVFDGFRSKEGGKLVAGITILDMLTEMFGPLSPQEQLEFVVKNGLGSLREDCVTIRGINRKKLSDEVLCGEYAATAVFGETCARGGIAGVMLLNLINEKDPGFLENSLPGIKNALKELQEIITHL
jgi:hypothetical protein